jgi:hypothetical protein
MSMTWNSRDSVRNGQTVAGLLCFFLLAACVAAPATDTPAPALVETLPTVSPPSEGPYHGERVTIRKAQAQAVSMEDTWIKRVVHPDDYSKLRAPVLISAEVTGNFSDLPRTASPIIVLNGQPLSNSIVVRDETDRVYAVVPDSTKLGPVLNIQVGWIGALPETLSPPVKVKLATENTEN